ncbi:MAG: protease modulator HflC [Stappiaceae bacterium]
MKSGVTTIVAIVVVIAAILAYSGLFIVNPKEQVLVLRFGKVNRVIENSGLHYKVPIVDNLVVLDKRILDLNMPPQEVIASDKKRLVVDAFARYKITNPVRFYSTVASIQGANLRLSTFLQSSLRTVLAKATFTAVVRDERNQLMDQIRTDVDRSADGIGIEVVDVKIRRADLPEENSQAIFDRMKTEREREATEIRARGEEQARRTRARADRDATVLVAEAKRDSEIIRGDGDAERNKIFAEAYENDTEFFAFYRSMQAYEASMKAGSTNMVISPDSSFFRYFENPLGAQRLPAPSSSAGQAAQ